MPTPEEKARETIDALLEAAGWRVQDRSALNLGAARGVAVREFPLTAGFAPTRNESQHKATNTHAQVGSRKVGCPPSKCPARPDCCG